MPVTLRDIAKHLNLSHATVSFVLNQRMDVAIPDATRQRVFQAARELGYRPNSLARALVSGRTQMLAVCLPTLRHPYYVGLFQSLFEVCQQHGYSVLVYQSFRSPTRRAVDWPVDGVIVADSAEMVRLGEIPDHLPVVCIGAFVDTEVDHVRIDMSEGAKEAVRHLVAVGCKQIVRVRVAEPSEIVDQRDVAYQAAIQEAGVAAEVINVEEPTAEAVRIAVAEYVKANGKPQAFFCTNDLSAQATVRSMADLGHFSPADYKIIGFEGSDEGELTVPSMTTVAQPVNAMCMQAVEFLLNRVKDRAIEVQSATLTCSLVVREST